MDKILLNEDVLENQDLYGIAQWFANHYGGGIGGKQDDYPREDIIDIVSDYIKSGKSKIGFIKWFAEIYGIYKGFENGVYQEFTKKSIITKRSKNIQEWIDQHFSGGHVTNGLITSYFRDKELGDIFIEHSFEDLKKMLTKDGIIMIDQTGKRLNNDSSSS